MFCPSCGANAPNDADFCSNCGVRLPKNTGTKNSNQSTYNNAHSSIPPQQPPHPSFSQHVQKKDIAVCIILSIITCSIYIYYWIYTMNEDLEKISPRSSNTSSGLLVLLGIITCGIYFWYWLYKSGETIDQIKLQRGIPSSNSGLLYMILSILGLSIVSYALLQNELNGLAD